MTTLKNTGVLKEDRILYILKPNPPKLEITRMKKRVIRKGEQSGSYTLKGEKIEKSSIYRDRYTLNFSKK